MPENKPTDSPIASLSAYDADIYERCVKFVIAERKATTSALQRRFSLSYAKAAVMLDLMEKMGVVGPAQGVKRTREVLVPNP